MRADATRNREKLLTAAAELFALRGTDVSLEAVAKRAGVGIGTLYRHFPTRDALVAAAYEAEVEDLRATADALLAEHPADVALERWMDRFIDYTATKRGMAARRSTRTFRPPSRARSAGRSRRCSRRAWRPACCAPTWTPTTSGAAMGAVWQVTDAEQHARTCCGADGRPAPWSRYVMLAA